MSTICLSCHKIYSQEDNTQTKRVNTKEGYYVQITITCPNCYRKTYEYEYYDKEGKRIQ